MKKFSIALITIILILNASVTYAAEPITGTAYGEQIGLMHMNYKTGENPFPSADESYFIGEWNQFYISPADGDFDNTGVPTFTAQISDLNDADGGCGVDSCLLKGFIWSDKIGWTILDGRLIQSSIEDNGGTFDEEFFARIDFNGKLHGYMWSEYTGWIKLSSDTGPDAGTFNPALAQTAENFGVYMNPLEAMADPLESASCETYLDQSTCESHSNICEWGTECNPKQIARGRHLHGYAWSEHLGWIQFDEDDFNIGTFTTWVPDVTPPEINAISETWFANQSSIGTIPWENFATDPESGIDNIETDLTINSYASPSFEGFCDAENITNILNGNDLNINMIHAGILPNAPKGFCMYEISGIIFNGAGIPYYMGIPADEVPNDHKTAYGNDGYNLDPITFFVRAGEMDLEETGFDTTEALTAIADGKNDSEYIFQPKDIAGNPIVPVKIEINPTNSTTTIEFDGEGNAEDANYGNLDNWVRSIVTDFNIQADSFFFDPYNVNSGGETIPVRIDDVLASEGGTTYDTTLLADSHITFSLEDNSASMDYPIQVVAYAPTSCGESCNNQKLILDEIEFTVTDNVTNGYTSPDPQIIIPNSGVLDGDKEIIELTINESNPDIAFSDYNYDFTPALLVNDGEVGSDMLFTGVPAEATFNIYNASPQFSGDIISAFAVDSILNFADTGGLENGDEVLDFRNINLLGNTDTEGRTDPTGIYGTPRYGLFSNGAFTNEDVTIFHNALLNAHPVRYAFTTEDSNGLDANGVYQVDGIYDVQTSTTEGPCGNGELNQGEECDDGNEEDDDGCSAECEIEGGIPPIEIDRGDVLVSIGSLFTYDIDNPLEDAKTITIGFTPYQWLGLGFDTEVEFSMDQYLAYKMQDAGSPLNQFAVYKVMDVIEGVGLRNIGLEATGTVTGEQVYESVSGRDLSKVTSPGSPELRTIIRTNVSNLTRNMTACAGTTLSSLPNSGNCVKVDTANNTIVAYYEGDVNLGNGLTAGGINVPNGYKYTLIVDGGNLLITDNIIKGNGISFGMIILEDDDGEGGNIFVTKDPTNIYGLAYAEGSLISSPNGTQYYYGAGSADAGELSNQLYWQGSIVSKNTIGGAPNRVVPDGVDCTGIDIPTCAQIYDLDYLRRFTYRTNEDGDFYVPSDVYFSSGGTCSNGANGVCSAGIIDGTTLSFDGVGFINVAGSKSVDPFFVEKASDPAPPGFEQSVDILR